MLYNSCHVRFENPCINRNKRKSMSIVEQNLIQLITRKQQSDTTKRKQTNENLLQPVCHKKNGNNPFNNIKSDILACAMD